MLDGEDAAARIIEAQCEVTPAARMLGLKEERMSRAAGEAPQGPDRNGVHGP